MVRVWAYKDKSKAEERDFNAEVKHKTYVTLEPSENGFLSLSTPEVTPVTEHIEHTVKKVTDELDALYKHVNYDLDFEIDVAIDRAETKTSWVEIEDEIDQIERELSDSKEPRK